jgi:hypothetical protein
MRSPFESLGGGLGSRLAVPATKLLSPLKNHREQLPWHDQSHEEFRKKSSLLC